MPYYTGSAANMSQVRDAIVNACTANGWSWSNEVLAKGGPSFRLSLSNGFLRIKGIAPAGESPGEPRMGPFVAPGSQSHPLVWPVTYHLFIHPGEVYCVIRYGVDVYQWLAFGRSQIAGMPGNKSWFGASASLDAMSYGIAGSAGGFNAVAGYYQNYSCFAPALFFINGGNVAFATSFIFDGFADRWTVSSFDSAAASPLLALQPSEWTSESALIPIRSYVARPENKISLAAELEHARHISIANLEPGQIITLGNDHWMCFPWYRKAVAFSGDTTGPLGWAIRYDGP